MRLSDEDKKKQILNCFLDLVEDISNKEYQQRVWVRGESPGYAFDDTCCDFFPESEAILEKYKDFGITERQCLTLKKFRIAFEDFSDLENSYWPSEFIDTPEWQEITEMAKEVLITFNYQKDSK